MAFFGIGAPARRVGFNEAAMNMYALPFEFKLERKAGAEMELSGCRVYPILPNKPFVYGTDPHDYLDKGHTRPIIPIKLIVKSSPKGRIKASLHEFQIFFGRELRIDIDSFVLNRDGTRILPWPQKKIKVVKSFDAKGKPVEYERVIAAPFAVKVDLKRGRTRDSFDVSFFAFHRPTAPNTPYYSPIWILGGKGKHVK